MNKNSDAEFSEPFYRLAYRVADLLDHINQLDAAAFHNELAQIGSELAQLQPESSSDNQQRSVLWQQLSMIVRQLEPCFDALNRQREAVPAAAPQAV